jgi:hypothetical protein
MKRQMILALARPLRTSMRRVCGSECVMTQIPATRAASPYRRRLEPIAAPWRSTPRIYDGIYRPGEGLGMERAEIERRLTA